MITEAQACEAMQSLAAMKYFPSDPYARAEIGSMLERMVSTAEQLQWLVETMIDNVREWPGPAEMRGIFCTRFKPRDGKEAWCSIPGFTASDSEAALSAPKQIAAQGRPTIALPSAAEMKALPLPAAEIEANSAVITEIATTCARVTDKDTGSQTIPKATAEDRAYTRRLLGHLYGLPFEVAE